MNSISNPEKDRIRHHVSQSHRLEEKEEIDMCVKVNMDVIEEIQKIAPQIKPSKTLLNAPEPEVMANLKKKCEMLEWMHKVDPVSKYSCPHCPNKFSSKNGYKKHLRYSHNTNEKGAKFEPIVRCKVCWEKFTTNAGLAKHVQKYHAGIKGPHRDKTKNSESQNPTARDFEISLPFPELDASGPISTPD